jgi:tetratricopeptide (TPR) repeat protein
VDETRARIFLAQDRADEAEMVARSAVKVLCKGDDAAQLAQALVTHGRALARLKRYLRAQEQLERALEIADGCGNREGGGQACLTMIEELKDVLPVYEVWALYERADGLLTDTQRPETITRLRECARTAFRVGRWALKADVKEGWHGCNILDEVLRYEHDLIEQAMAASGGRITQAAKRLETSQTLHRSLFNPLL